MRPSRRQSRILSLAGTALALAPVLAPARAAIPVPAGDAALSQLLQQQTQAFSEAGQAGDKAAMDRLLDPAVVFTSESGETGGKADVLDGVAPPPAGTPKSRIEVTQWALHRQRDDLATATFVDVVTRSLGSQTLVLHFQSTETWVRRPDGWKMVASQTMNVVAPPKPIALPDATLADYVGTYELYPGYRVTISRAAGGLAASTNGGPPVPLRAEIKDVLFTPGVPNARRLFQRDATGRVEGYISRRDGVDLVLRKVV